MNHFTITVRDLAHARSGDKGSSANIGVIAHTPFAYTILCKHLTAEAVTAYFGPLGVEETRRYELPNIMALNFVLKQVLDGGGSHSLRIDAQGKALGQAILDLSLMVSLEEWQQLSSLTEQKEESLVTVSTPHPALAVVGLNRPDKRNALNLALVHALIQKFEELNDAALPRAIILRGEGSVFCSGMDLHEAADSEKGKLLSHALGRLYSVIYNSPHLTIAAGHGAVMAGGIGLLSACDLAVAAEGTLFALPETRRGLVAAQVMTLLMRQISPRFIRELTLLGEPVNTDWALRTGLINRVATEHELIDAAQSLGLQAARGGEEAVRQTKEFCDYLYPSPFISDLERAQACLNQCKEGEEAIEGMAAFLEKREPRWLHH